MNGNKSLKIFNTKTNGVNDNLSKQKLILCLIGAVTGLVNGLFGGGGGMVIVPFLIYLLKYPVKTAHATAIMIILPLSVLSGLLYASYVNVDLTALFVIGGGVIFGGVLGAFLLSKFTNKWLIVIFSVIMICAGVKMMLF